MKAILCAILLMASFSVASESNFSYNVAETDTLVIDLNNLNGAQARKEGPKSVFSITGGVDQVHFIISEDDMLLFRLEPDFEIPVDANQDNIYEVQITEVPVSGNSNIINIKATVTDVVSGDCDGSMNEHVSDMLLEFDDDATTWLNDSNTIQIQLNYHEKYVIQNLNIVGDHSGLHDFDHMDGDNGWDLENVGECVSARKKTISWSDLINSGTDFQLTEADSNGNDITPSYSWFVRATLTEEFIHQNSKGEFIYSDRTLQIDLPLKLQFVDELTLEANINTEIEDTSIADVIDGLFISVPNLENNANVTISLKTEVTYPWKIDVSDYNVTEHDNVIQSGTDHSLLEDDYDCEIEKDALCIQQISLNFISTGICDAKGKLDLHLKVKYLENPNEATKSHDMVMNLELGKAVQSQCAVIMGTLPVTGIMKTFDEDQFVTESSAFYLGNSIFVEGLLHSYGTMNSISIDSITLKQEGNEVCVNCETKSKLNYGLLTSPSNNGVRFQLDLADEYLIGGTGNGMETQLIADISIEYTQDRRRVLKKYAGEEDEQVYREHLKIQKSFNVKKSPCPGAKIGDLERINCSKEDRVSMRICKENGWEIIIDQCDKHDILINENAITDESDLREIHFSSSIVTEESSNNSTNTIFIFFSFVLLILFHF